MFSYHYLEHRAEDLGVLCHTAYVELPGEDGRVVILIVHLNKHLGCVGCKKHKWRVTNSYNKHTLQKKKKY